MRGLLALIIRYHFILLFLAIEFVSLFLVVQNNSYQKAGFINSSNHITGSIYDAFNSFSSYLNLSEVNDHLSKENARLRNNLSSLYIENKIELHSVVDSTYQQQYEFITARAINNTTNKLYNYITLNKGKKQGVNSEMGVVSPNGVIGVVKNVSRNFASIISILNPKLLVSAKIEKNNYYGPLTWDGRDPQLVKLMEIPYHVKVGVGDKIVTSGFSTIFPGGIEIGIITDFELKEGENYFDITVKLSADLHNIQNVYVVSNLLKNEQKQIEAVTEND